MNLPIFLIFVVLTISTGCSQPNPSGVYTDKVDRYTFDIRSDGTVLYRAVSRSGWGSWRVSKDKVIVNVPEMPQADGSEKPFNAKLKIDGNGDLIDDEWGTRYIKS
jgi:hypothetical protein